MLSIESIFWTVLYVIVGGVIFGLFIWLIDWCEIKEPFRRVARIILGVTAVFVLVAVLLSLVGHPVVRW